MFGLEEAEVIDRRKYVQHVKREIEVRIATTYSLISQSAHNSREG
jgi:hypothetical protein